MAAYSDSELRELGIADFGERVRVSRFASIYGAENLRLGSDVRIDDFCILSGDSAGIELGNFIHIAAYASLIGHERITMEDFSTLSSRVSVYSSSDDYSGEYLTNPTVPEDLRGVDHRPVFIGRHVIIGSGAVILPGTVIDEGVAVGALSLVRGHCRSFGVYVGIPACRIAERRRDLLGLEAQLLQRLGAG